MGGEEKKVTKWSCKSAQKLSKNRRCQKARQLCAPHCLRSSLTPLLKCEKNCSLLSRYCPGDMALQEKWLVLATALPLPASFHPPPGLLQPSGKLRQGISLRHHIPLGPKPSALPWTPLELLWITVFIPNSENTFQEWSWTVAGFMKRTLFMHTEAQSHFAHPCHRL